MLASQDRTNVRPPPAPLKRTRTRSVDGGAR
jgi:hypothetical protein